MKPSGNHKRPSRRLGLTVLSASTCTLIIGAFIGHKMPAGERQDSLGLDLKRTVRALIEGAQADDPPTDHHDQLSADKLDAYIRVYSAMQRDHGLPLELAAKQQGLSVDAFRQIEERVESNDALRRRVRRVLVEAAKHPEHAYTGAQQQNRSGAGQ